MEGKPGFNTNEKAFISGQSELSADYIKEKRELVIEQATGLRNLYEAKKLLEKFESEHTTYDVLTAEEAKKGPENPFQGLIDALEEGRKKVVRIPENDLRNFAEINACVGNLDRAVEIAESIKDDRYGSRAIAEVAKFFIEKGELGDAEILLAKTLPKGSYGGWDDGPLYKVQFKLIEALISSGDEERAIQIAGTLPDKAETSAFLYKAIVLHHGNADATALVEQLDSNEKVAAYSRLADFEIDRGNKDAAERFIQRAEAEVPHMQFPDKHELWIRVTKSGEQDRLSEKRNRLEKKQGEQESEGYHEKLLKAVKDKNLDEAIALVKEAEAADYESSLRNYRHYGGNISMRHENDGIADANLQIASLYHEKGDAEHAKKYLERAYSWADPFRGAARILKETKNLGYKPLVYKSLRSTFAALFKKMDAGEEYSTFSPLTNYVGGPLGEKPQALIDIQLELEDFKGALNTYKHFKNRDLFIRILKAQAETAYTQLQAAKAKGIDELDAAKMLPYALEAHDEQLIEALGGIIPEEEKKQIVDYENISKDDQARLVFGRSMSAGKDDEREYRELQTQAAGLLSEYSKSGDLGDRAMVKKMITTLDELSSGDAAVIIAAELKNSNVENPHTVRLLKYLLDSDSWLEEPGEKTSEHAEKIAYEILRQEGLPKRYFSYIAKKLRGESIEIYQDRFKSANVRGSEFLEMVEYTDPVLHSYIVKSMIDSKDKYAADNARRIIAHHIYSFKQLDSEVAKKLDGFEWREYGAKNIFSVVENPSSFKDLDNTVAFEIIKKGRVNQLLTYEENFLPFDRTAFHAFFDEQIEAKNWKAIAGLSKIEVCKEKFDELFGYYERIASDAAIPFPERKKAFDFLAGLSQEGAISVQERLVEIIQARSKQKESPESKWGLDPAQEAAFYTLMRLDTEEVNQALFKMLLNDNVSEVVKQAVIRKLLRARTDFTTKNTKAAIDAWFQKNRGGEIEWNDLSFPNAIATGVASSDLRAKSLASLDSSSLIDDIGEGSVYRNWQKQFKNIPDNIFLQLRSFVGKNGDPAKYQETLGKFQILYKAISKEGSRKEDLQYGIVNCLGGDKKLMTALVAKLGDVDFATRRDAETLSKTLRQVVFLNNLAKVIGGNYSGEQYEQYDDDYDYDYHEDERAGIFNKDDETEAAQGKLIEDIVGIFEQTDSLSSLNGKLEELISVKIMEILPHPDITPERIELLTKQWGDLEPIFTYVGRYPRLKKYVAEIAAYSHSQETWKKWRYDTGEPVVESQIGGLTDEQLIAWGKNYTVELGDLDLNERGGTKPQEVRNILTEAVVDFKHIYNPNEKVKGSEFIQGSIESAFKKVLERPGEADRLLKEEMESMKKVADGLNVLIKSRSVPQYRQILEDTFAAGSRVSASSKTKNLLGLLSNALSPELKKELNKNYQSASAAESKDFVIDECITPSMREYLKNEFEAIEQQSVAATASGLGASSETKDLYGRRNEISAVIDLLRLANLDNKLIATNQISEQENKTGESLSSVVKDLQKYFKDTAFELDLKNIESKIHQRDEIHQTRRVAMVFTDDPQILWQIGKYPLGNGSCQHYAEGSMAEHLMGYVGDANCKAACMIDVNALPQDYKEKIEKGSSINEVIDTVPKADLLRALLARVIIKLGKSEDEKPAIVIEPT